jgi:hypothetical protein
VLEFELVALLRQHFAALPDAAVTLLRRAFASGAIAMRSETPIPDSGFGDGDYGEGDYGSMGGNPSARRWQSIAASDAVSLNWEDWPNGPPRLATADAGRSVQWLP